MGVIGYGIYKLAVRVHKNDIYKYRVIIYETSISDARKKALLHDA